MSRHDFARDPCPWRLVEDMGGAYSMGLVGGGFFHGVKTALKRERNIMRMIRTQSPKTAAGFAAWGFTFSSFDCTLIRLRRKEDMWNSIIAGGATGFTLAVRQGMAPALVSGGVGCLLLGMIEAGSLIMNRFGTEMLKPTAPKMENEAPKAFD